MSQQSGKCSKNFAQATDMYANSVTLSYNGSKSHATVPGGLCSIICIMLITYQMITTFRKFRDPEYTNVIRNNKILVLDQADPLIYNISRDEVTLMTSLTAPFENYEQYYSGVYVQKTYNTYTKQEEYVWIDPVPCG